jgi:hypothetical protein
MSAAKIITYVVGFGAAAGSIAFGIISFAGHKPVHQSLPLLIFGVFLLVAMIFVAAWNKAGTPSAGAGDTDTGLSSAVDLNDGQWVLVIALVAVGLIGAILTGTLIHG